MKFCLWLGMLDWPDGGCAAGLGGLVCGYGAAWGAVPGPPALPSFQAGLSSRQPSSELAEGRGLLTLTNGFHPRRRRALPLAAGVCPRQSCGLGGHLLARAKAPGGDVSVPGDAAGKIAWIWRISAAAIAARACWSVSRSSARPVMLAYRAA